MWKNTWYSVCSKSKHPSYEWANPGHDGYTEAHRIKNRQNHRNDLRSNARTEFHSIITAYLGDRRILRSLILCHLKIIPPSPDAGDP